MKELCKISKHDLVKVANLEGIQNNKNNMIHLYLDEEGEIMIQNHIIGVSSLKINTVLFLKTKYIFN